MVATMPKLTDDSGTVGPFSCHCAAHHADVKICRLIFLIASLTMLNILNHILASLLPVLTKQASMLKDLEKFVVKFVLPKGGSGLGKRYVITPLIPPLPNMQCKAQGHDSPLCRLFDLWRGFCQNC
jgi:hypothetical protein